MAIEGTYDERDELEQNTHALQLSKRREQTTIVSASNGLAAKRVRAATLIASFAAAGAAAVVVPLPMKDALLLSPLELAEINALADVYGITKDESVRQGFAALVELGAVSVAGRKAIDFLRRKPLPGIAKRATNAVTAASVVATVGVCAAYSFEQMYLGHSSVEDFGVFRKFTTTETWHNLREGITSAVKQSLTKGNFGDLGLSIADLLNTAFAKAH